MRALIILMSGLSFLLLAHPNPQATATLRDGGGRELGTLTLTDSPQGIRVTGTLNGLPDGEHAIHLHGTGRCQQSFQAAGSHWNPTKRDHGQHLGDLPNITARAGEATVNGTTPGGTLRGDQPLLDSDGAAVIVHAGPDDYQSQPAGNSGDRIACGEIRE